MKTTFGLLVTCLWVAACGCSTAQETQSATKSRAQKESNPISNEVTVTDETKNQGDWPMFRGNPQSTGVATSTLPLELEVLWEFQVPKGAFEGSAAIVENEGKKVAYIGDLDGQLISLDLETGEKRWAYEAETGIGFSTSPSYHNGKVYIGDLDGLFYCVNDQGEKVWSFQTNAEISSCANFFEGNVIVGSQDANLYCLSCETGEVVWKLQADDQIRCTPTIVEGRAFVAGCDGRLHVIDLKQGEELGSVDIQSPTGGSPAALGDSVYFGTEQAGFFAVRWNKPELKWHFDREKAEDDPLSAIRSNPAVTENHVIFGAADRVVRSLDPKTKTVNWATTLKTRIETSPVVVGQRVFVASGDGRLHALDLETGKVVMEKEFEGGFMASPSVGFGRMIIASDRGTVYCLGSKSE
jgi:outer membrane protein assembly factor BamB